MKAPLAQILAIAAMLAPAPAVAQVAEEQQRQVRQVIVYGNDPCPEGTGDEVVVCARRPETERYRLPPNARAPEPNARNNAWADRARTLEDVGETGADSCSTVGAGGQTGCLRRMIDRSEGVDTDADATSPPQV